MEDKKVSSEKELKLVKTNDKKKEWTVKRILTTVIIVILALLMVGGSFYYIFSPSFRNDANAFGTYDGEPVLYEANNMFSRTLASDPDYAAAATSGDYNALWTSWYKAYQSQVIYIALAKYAKEAKILAPQTLVEKMIIESGAFNNENGEFDAEIYKATPDTEKRAFFNYMKTIYPYQTVIADIYNTVTSAQESAFVAQYASDTKTFDYFVVDCNTYPNTLAVSYVYNHLDDFKLLDVSVISCVTEEDAKSCYSELNTGLAWADAVAKYSQDSYAANEGAIGSDLFACALATNMKDASSVSMLINMNEGEYSMPIEGPSSWAIYKLNAPVKDIDFEEEDMYKRVKQMIYLTEPDEIQPYIDTNVSLAETIAKEDFDTAASTFSTGLVSVGPASNNIGNSEVFYGLDSYDYVGTLSNAVASDSALNKELFTETVGHVAGPIAVDGGYLFVRTSAESKEQQMGDLTEALYKFYVGQFNLFDVQQSILSSDKHKDDFTTKFFSMLLGNLQ